MCQADDVAQANADNPLQVILAAGGSQIVMLHRTARDLSMNISCCNTINMVHESEQHTHVRGCTGCQALLSTNIPEASSAAPGWPSGLAEPSQLAGLHPVQFVPAGPGPALPRPGS